MESKGIQTLKAHVALNVKDVGRSVEFYRRMLGLEPSKVRRGYAKFDVETPPLNLTLNENQFGERGALSHMGLQVASTEDVLALRERWRAAGLKTFDEMQTSCCYAVQGETSRGVCRLRRSAHVSCWPRSSALESWASVCRAATWPWLCWRTRSPPARRSSL